MSTLQQLAILGIRSFDSNKLQTIKFDGPLTLIVGANGSGKTTIIECLKYATTGELPPNSKGGAFIHDPDLNAERATKAQVRLKFEPTMGGSCQSTRNSELVVKPKGARSMNTLDCLLVIKDRNGEITKRSTRVAEMNAEIPRLLGVSKAILDSVIFCHQEESLWPMSEPAALKKRFDEIFEAQKYIKAIDSLKKMAKEKNVSLKLAEKDLEYLAINKKAAADLGKKNERILADMAEIDETIKELGEKFTDAETNLFASNKAASEFTEVIEKLKSVREKSDWYKQQLQDLGQNLIKRNESDEELDQELAQFTTRAAQREQLLQQETSQARALQRDINNKIDDIGNKKGEVGKYENRKADHERNIADREAAVKKSARAHDFRGFDTDLDIMQINDYMEKISRLSKDQTSKVERLRTENERKQLDAQKLLDGIRREQTALEANRSSKKDQIASTDRRLKERQTESDKFTIDEAGIASLEDRAAEIKASLQAVQAQHSSSDLDAKQRQHNTKIQQLEAEEATLFAESREVSSRAAELAQVDLLKKNVKNTRRDLENKINTYKTEFNGLVGSSWQPANLEKLFQKVQKDLKDKVAGAKRQHDGVAREIERVDDRVRVLDSNVKTKEKEVNQCVKAIDELAECAPGDFLTELANAEKTRNEQQSVVDNFSGMKGFFEQAAEMAKHDKKCKLCTRGFKEQKEIDQVVKHLNNQFSDKRQKEMQQDLKSFIEDVKALQELIPQHTTWLRLSQTELPPLREELEKLTTKRTQLALNVNKEEESVAEAEEALRDAEKLIPQVTAITTLNAEESKLEQQLAQATAKQGLSKSSRTADDIDTDLDCVKSSLRELRQSITKMQTEANQYRDQISKLRDDQNDADKDLGIAKHQLQSKASITKQIDDLKQSKQELRQAVAQLDNQLGELLPQLQSKEAELRRQKSDAHEEERTANEQANRLQAEVKELMQLDYAIQKYDSDGGPANLARAHRDVQVLENEKTALQGKFATAGHTIEKIKHENSDQDRVKRIIQDNINYRKLKKEFENAREEIARLSSQNAEADQEQHRKEAERWQRLRNAASTEMAGEMATKKEKDGQYRFNQGTLESTYKDVDKNYTKANIEVVTLGKIVKDLGTYATALNNAIMEYHGTKMEQINRIIAELWTATYQGTDIDTICIRSEHETTRSNRSYNYRVTMIKQSAEMDMRGRCSAGQRVLASIIIRLALAECFSEYCGMIALDEPTTNLDRENIRSLAESLHEIINARKSQKNFQLIVITHDEDFLKVMRPSDHADVYYRVFRNQKQKSEIVQQQMFEL